MQPSNAPEEIVFRSPWFQVLSQPGPHPGKPYYTIHGPDFVVIVALDSQGRLLLVRQYRPAVAMVTLELPAGHVENGETPEEAARKELREETGCEADAFELLATLSPSTARNRNRMWCFFAPNARRSIGATVEAGMEPIFYDQGIRALLEEKDFFSAGNYAALFAAVAKGRIRL